MTPSGPDVDDDLILGPGEVAMATVLDPAPGPVEQVPVARRRTRLAPLLCGFVVAASGIVWYVVAVVSGLANTPVEVVDAAMPVVSGRLLPPQHVAGNEWRVH